MPLFTPETDVLEKASAIATRMYKAEGLELTTKAQRELDRIRSWGYGHLPVCMAKTQYSFSHDASLLGAPSGFTVPVREFRLNAGAGFVVARCPGLAEAAVGGPGPRGALQLPLGGGAAEQAQQ